MKAKNWAGSSQEWAKILNVVREWSLVILQPCGSRESSTRWNWTSLFTKKFLGGSWRYCCLPRNFLVGHGVWDDYRLVAAIFLCESRSLYLNILGASDEAGLTIESKNELLELAKKPYKNRSSPGRNLTSLRIKYITFCSITDSEKKLENGPRNRCAHLKVTELNH